MLKHPSIGKLVRTSRVRNCSEITLQFTHVKLFLNRFLVAAMRKKGNYQSEENKDELSDHRAFDKILYRTVVV